MNAPSLRLIFATPIVVQLTPASKEKLGRGYSLMLHMVLRQRRRFAFALLLTQLAFLNLWSQSLIFGVMILGTIVGVAMVAASGNPIRRLVECGAIGLLACTRMPTVPMIAMVFLGTTALAYAILYTPLLDRTPLRIGLQSRKKFTAPYDRRTAWSKVIPGQGHPAAYWTGTMMSVEADDHDEHTLYITFKEDRGEAEDVTVTFLNLEPHTYARFLTERDTLLAGEEVIMCYHFTKIDNELTEVHSDMRVSGLPLRHAVERFFDDVLGDELDSFATMTECKRRWHLRQVGDLALTSELGQEGVALKVALNAPLDADDIDDDMPVRISA